MMLKMELPTEGKKEDYKGVYRFNEGGHEEDWCDRRR